MQVVADTSAIVSLGVVADHTPDPLACILTAHDLSVPSRVLDELEETAAYNDPSGRAAAAILDRRDQFVVCNVELDKAFPLDDGENAAVRLANDIGGVTDHGADANDKSYNSERCTDNTEN